MFWVIYDAQQARNLREIPDLAPPWTTREDLAVTITRSAVEASRSQLNSDALPREGRAVFDHIDCARDTNTNHKRGTPQFPQWHKRR